MAKSKRTTVVMDAHVDARPEHAGEPPRTLAIDIGGSPTKASVLARSGVYLADRVRVPTPAGSAPEALIATVLELVEPLPPFERVSVGFPGVVRDGVVRTAPNLDHDGWKGFDLAGALGAKLGKPIRV